MQQVEKTVEALKAQMETLQKRSPEDKLSMIVFSGDMDKIMAALVIATGAVAMGMDAILFFTFWGIPSLRDKTKFIRGKSMMDKMLSTILPKGPNDVQLSKINMAGLGKAMMKSMMKKKNVASLKEMFSLAEELGVRIVICEMSMDLMGFKREEIIPYKYLEFGGVAKFLEEASSSKIQLFI
jgi:peroxiredoxin family protein